MSDKETEELAIKLLEKPFWPPMLDVNKFYFRTHDDCDGNMEHGIEVVISKDGDAWVQTTSHGTCRFRNGIGGGMSLRTRNALLLLAMAIELDEKEKPQK